MSKWTFVTNHALVLSYINRHPLITARELSLEIGITERAVRKIIADLEAEGYIFKIKEGRRVRYIINAHLPLRHRSQRNKKVADLLRFLSIKSKPAEGKK